MGKHEPLGILLDPSSALVEAYVAESDLGRLSEGVAATFYAENGETVIPLRLQAIDRLSTREVTVPELASVNGGGIAVRQDSAKRLVPEASIYRLLLKPAVEPLPPRAGRRRGTVVMDAQPESLLLRLWRNAVSVVIRESNL
ncbi:MAG: HlyD family secretion protein [Magnetospirillum sp.]|nr:HlyD family secretion protein [Magnetospirillum sp.]